MWPALVSAGGFDFSDLEFQAGGIGIIAPKYEGSKSYEAVGVPFAFPGGKDGDDDLSFVDLDSVQYRIIKAGSFEAGPLAGLWLGRSDTDGAKLAGLGDIDAGLVIGGYGAYRLGYTKFQASYHHQVTGEEVGGLLRFRVDAEVPVSPGFKLLAGVGTNYATNRFMDKNFGVSASQTATSLAGLPAYNPGADFKDVFVGAGLEMDLSERWTARLYGEYSRLIGDAADSPLIETEDQFFGLLAISYQFGSHVAEHTPAPLK
jgi:MipA family protein